MENADRNKAIKRSSSCGVAADVHKLSWIGFNCVDSAFNCKRGFAAIMPLWLDWHARSSRAFPTTSPRGATDVRKRLSGNQEDKEAKKMMNRSLVIFTAAAIMVGARLFLNNPQIWIDVGIVFLFALFPARVFWNGLMVAYQIDPSGEKNTRRYYIGMNMMLSVISFWIVFSVRGDVNSPSLLIILLS